ncbi:MAG TPA: permease prefix domain 1-containing protein [Thermoanaerobaculia bacterium]
MHSRAEAASLDEQIEEWRSYVGRNRAIEAADVAELEDHLREQIETLIDSGLSEDEAFLVSVRRMGNLDAISREFAREHSERLWKQLVMPVREAGERSQRSEALVVFALAAVAAAIVRVPGLFGFRLDEGLGFYLVPFLVLPLLTGYFAWKRRLDAATIAWLTGAYVIAAILVLFYPFVSGSQTEVLAVMHLPVALLLMVGIAYAGVRWNQVTGRMDFVRFLGELCIYYVLTAAVGGLVVGAVAGIFRAVGIPVDLELWLLPSGAAAAVFIATWLVEAKQSVIENLAPVMARIFTPLFAALMMVLLVSLLWTGFGAEIDRGLLRGFLLLLVVVLAFLLFSISARNAQAPPGLFDVAQATLVVSALLVAAAALWAIAARIHEFGLTPNRAAALGLTVILLVNLAWSAALYIGFVRRRFQFARIERWQTDFLTVYVVWAAVVAVLFPPAFGYG